MSDNLCPDCRQPLDWQGHYYCSHCQQRYVKLAHCPDCPAELEKLQACGAASYFCPQCNELKSKSRVRISFQRDDSITEE
ncbi:zinc ribbon domain-containing protein [Vibrio sp.]|uniref:zinc ribbon domain-containing protein n=1 Tax=Vibrio sp. TaxID=678 RepID=UPI003D11F559